MVLVDTSVWVEHFRKSNARLVGLLQQGEVFTHCFVIGELACGNLAQRAQVLTYLAALPQVPVAGHEEVLAFLEAWHLMGRGLGWIDMHLLASAMLAKLPFWTLDKRLRSVVTEFGAQLHD
jgi:predicted nucleic acid-binding protein